MTPRQHLVVVVPGIGGTQLAVPDGAGRPGPQLLWSASPQDLGLLRCPERLSVNVHPRLAPAGLIRARKAFGLWTVVRGYDRLLAQLAEYCAAVVDDGTGEPNLDAGVVAFGYDFRLGVADAARQLDRVLQPRLERRWPNPCERERRVVFVAHSMGGLVSRYWAAVLGGARWCRALITLGTPHRGAPKALDVMANGVRLGRLPVRLKGTVALAREWQGMADLLPRYPAVEDLTSQPDARGSDAQKLDAPRRRPQRRPHELPLPWLTGNATRAHRMHQEIEDGWAALRTPPAVFPRIGFGHRTLRACTWDGTEIGVTAAMPAGDDVGRWGADRGDGTVPTYCGLPVEMDNYPQEDLRVHRRHGPIADLDLERLVNALAQDAPLSPFRAADEADVGLAMDLDELHLAGTGIPIRTRAVSTSGEQVDAGGAVVWATARPLEPGRRTEQVRLEWDVSSGAFEGVLPGQTPGLVEVSVVARSLTDAPATQTVEVLGDDDLE